MNLGTEGHTLRKLSESDDLKEACQSLIRLNVRAELIYKRLCGEGKRNEPQEKQ